MTGEEMAVKLAETEARREYAYCPSVQTASV